MGLYAERKHLRHGPLNKKTDARPRKANAGLLFLSYSPYDSRISVTRIFRLNTAPSLDSLNDG